MIKESDMKIISELRSNARQTLTNISKVTKIPTSTIYDRIKLQEKNIIKKHTSILDFPSIGYNIRLHLMINTKDKNKFSEFINDNPNINTAFSTEGEYNFIMDCIFQKMDEMQSFMEELEKQDIERKHSSFITDQIISENFMNGGE